MGFLDDLKKVIDGEIEAEDANTNFKTSQIVQDQGVDGMGIVQAINESDTDGKRISVKMANGDTVIALPGTTPVIPGQRVTVSGGRVIG